MLEWGVESHEFAGICDGDWGHELMNYERNSIIIVSWNLEPYQLLDIQ